MQAALRRLHGPGDDYVAVLKLSTTNGANLPVASRAWVIDGLGATAVYNKRAEPTGPEDWRDHQAATTTAVIAGFQPRATQMAQEPISEDSHSVTTPAPVPSHVFRKFTHGCLKSRLLSLFLRSHGRKVGTLRDHSHDEELFDHAAQADFIVSIRSLEPDGAWQPQHRGQDLGHPYGS